MEKFTSINTSTTNVSPCLHVQRLSLLRSLNKKPVLVPLLILSEFLDPIWPSVTQNRAAWPMWAELSQTNIYFQNLENGKTIEPCCYSLTNPLCLIGAQRHCEQWGGQGQGEQTSNDFWVFWNGKAFTKKHIVHIENLLNWVNVLSPQHVSVLVHLSFTVIKLHEHIFLQKSQWKGQNVCIV